MDKKIVAYTPRDKWEPTFIEDKYLTHTDDINLAENTLGDLPMCTECDNILECIIVRDALALERTYSISVAIIECPRFVQSTGRK